VREGTESEVVLGEAGEAIVGGGCAQRQFGESFEKGLADDLHQ
jgi:hypothetical protein